MRGGGTAFTVAADTLRQPLILGARQPQGGLAAGAVKTEVGIRRLPPYGQYFFENPVRVLVTVKLPSGATDTLIALP